MQIADIPGASQRVVIRGRARITPKYAIEIMVRENDGHHTVGYRWYPTRPSWWEIDELWQEIAEASAPYLRKAMQLGGLHVVGAA